jgi:hypothetical protein
MQKSAKENFRFSSDAQGQDLTAAVGAFSWEFLLAEPVLRRAMGGAGAAAVQPHHGGFSLDLLCACTGDDLQAALEAEWAKLAARREIMLVERHGRALHTSLADTAAARAPTPPTPPSPTTPSSRVLKMRWGSTGEPLVDTHLLQVTQRPNSWTAVVVQTEAFTAELFLGATTLREKRLFQSSCPADICARRPPPRREEYRRSAKTSAQLHDEARRIAAADPDISLPSHWAADENRPETRLEMLAFLLQHDCKQRQATVVQFGAADAASIERMATELELRWVRENPIHVIKIGRFDYAMEFKRLLEPGEERQYTALRSMELCRWITTEFWDVFNRINGGDWISGSLVSGRPLDAQPKAVGLLAWRPCRKPLQELWKKCPPQRFAFPFYFELLEDQQLVENIHDKIAELATMVREKLGAEKLPWWERERLPFVVSGLTKPDSSEMLDSETLRNDLKRNNCAMLRYAIFGSARGHAGSKDSSNGSSAAAAATTGAGQDGPHSAADRLEMDRTGKDAVSDYDAGDVSYEQMLVKRGPVVEHPSVAGRKVRVVQVMSLRGDTLGSALETLKYLRKSMAGKRERTTIRKEYPGSSGQRIWEYSREGDKGAQHTWVQYAIQWQDRLNAAWLSGEGCDWSLESHQKSFQRIVRKGTVVKNALVLSLPCKGETLIGFEEPPSTSGIQVDLATGSSVQVRGRRGNFAERLRRLEGMTLVLQRKHIKTLFRRVGMFAMEVASDSATSKRVFLVITAANHKFAERAEALQLRTKLHVDTEGGKFTFLGGFRPEMFLRGAPLLEFWRESAHRQYPYDWFWQGGNPSDPADCFTSVDRLRMLNDLINTSAQLRVAELQANDVVTRLFPLHDPDTLEHLRLHWAKPWRVAGHSWLRHPFYQDIDTIREYFGVHIAFYFEWLEFYTKWLTAPTAIGVLIYFSKAVMAVEHFQDIVEVEREHDLYPYFALFMALWATLFLEFWKRKSKLLAYQWDIQPHSAVEHVRPQFVAVLRNKFSEDSLMSHLRSIVEPEPTKGTKTTRRQQQGTSHEGAATTVAADDEMAEDDDQSAFSDADLKGDLAQHDELVFYPPVKRTMKRLATFPLMLAMIIALVTVLGWVYVGGLQDWADKQALNNAGSEPGSEPSEQAQYRSYVVVGIANGIAIPILNVVYKKIAVSLTEWELHRTVSDAHCCIIHARLDNTTQIPI